MKKFIVTATAPATAKITLSAECREEAIDKAESIIDDAEDVVTSVLTEATREIHNRD